MAPPNSSCGESSSPSGMSGHAAEPVPVSIANAAGLLQASGCNVILNVAMHPIRCLSASVRQHCCFGRLAVRSVTPDQSDCIMGAACRAECRALAFGACCILPCPTASSNPTASQ